MSKAVFEINDAIEKLKAAAQPHWKPLSEVPDDERTWRTPYFQRLERAMLDQLGDLTVRAAVNFHAFLRTYERSRDDDGDYDLERETLFAAQSALEWIITNKAPRSMQDIDARLQFARWDVATGDTDTISEILNRLIIDLHCVKWEPGKTLERDTEIEGRMRAAAFTGDAN